MHAAIHANHMGHHVHPHANPIYQRHDFQNRRSASEPVHELQAGNRLANTASIDQSTNPNNSNESNHQPSDDCNYVECLQKITTVKVRCLPKPNTSKTHSIQYTTQEHHWNAS